MKPLLFAGSAAQARDISLGRRQADVEARLTPVLPDIDDVDLDRPVVILLDRAMMLSVPDARARAGRLAAVAALVGCGVPGESEPGDHLPVELLTSYIPGDASPATAALLLTGAMRHASTLRAERMAREDADRRYQELRELTDVGVALATQRELIELLELILTQARRLTYSDAASLYLVESAGGDNGQRRLRFKLSQNFSRPRLELGEFTLPVDRTSLAGYAADTGVPLAIPDVYRMGEGEGYRQNRSFDERFGYRTKSVLAIPLCTHRGTTVGVLQLINRKRFATALLATDADVSREVVPYDRRAVELVSALAAQAAVAIDNSLLYQSIERLFEGFVTAAVTGIESRDPTTFGHSARVAGIAVSLAESLEQHGTGRYLGTRFTREQLRELRYASLLHDFGKVSVPEAILVKAKKLHPEDLERMRQRFARARHAAALRYERGRGDLLRDHGPRTAAAAIEELATERDAELAKLAALWQAVEAINEPASQVDAWFDELASLATARFTESDGSEHDLVEARDMELLRIPRGTLHYSERDAFQDHVSHTRRFLSVIPWTPELRAIPEIASAHHEKLNGAGYPRGLRGEAISLQTRILTIADIYDALTSTDRPYKKAVSHEQAMRILYAEAAAGELDADLVKALDASRPLLPTPALAYSA